MYITKVPGNVRHSLKLHHTLTTFTTLIADKKLRECLGFATLFAPFQSNLRPADTQNRRLMVYRIAVSSKHTVRPGELY